jgi:hypothetical protein
MRLSRGVGAGFWLALLVLAGILVYERTSDSQRWYLRNLLSQAKDLPARYQT